MKNISLQISGAQHALSTINTKRSTPSYIIIKPLKDKDRARKQQINLIHHMQETKIRFTDFSSEKLGNRRQWDDIFKVLKAKRVNPKF